MKDGEEISEKAIQHLKILPEFNNYEEALDELIQGYYEGSWFKWAEDIKLISMMDRDKVFELQGVGDGYDDQWIAYFKNGMMQFCLGEVVFDPFNESKLE